MEPLKKMTTSELMKIIKNTDLDLALKIQAQTEILRREKEWKSNIMNF